MQIVYYLLIAPISRLPLNVIYKVSDVLYFIIYRIVGYRTKVVFGNLRNSFPEKSHEELKQIEKEFYRHLCDIIMESFKGFSISRELVHDKIKHFDAEIINQFHDQGKDVVLIGGHNGNWEWLAITIDDLLKHQTLALYAPLRNKFMDRKMKESRGRFGLQLMSVGQAKQALDTLTGDTKYVLIFGSDQCPKRSQKAFWMRFLNQETAVQFGAEKFARERNMPVVMGNIYKTGRGKYEVRYELITDDPSKLPVGEITYRFTKRLEEIIKQHPQYWLWSHKRWKIPRPSNEVLYGE